MQGMERVSVDLLLKGAKDCIALGIPVLALFPVIDVALKTPDGIEAINPGGPLPPPSIRFSLHYHVQQSTKVA